MAGDDSAREIGWRFRDEREYIERYVRLLRLKSTLHDRQVSDLNRTLKRVEIKPLPTRRYDRIGQPYLPDEVKSLLDAIRETGPEVYQTILGHEQRLDDIPSIPMNAAVDDIDRLFEWVGYFMERLPDDPEKDEVDSVLQNAIEDARTVDEDVDEDERMAPTTLRTLLSAAVDHALYAKIRERVDAMVYAREQFEEIEILARMGVADSEINVLRQGFVLLMTAFDAAVFDLTRIALRRKFFDLIGAFAEKDKVTLKILGEAGSFETFRDKMIEDQLKKRYLKDLLSLLETLGVNCTDETVGDRPVELIELVLRRNVHIHNRGIVDERYLELDATTGKPKYNLYSLNIGDSAIIDDEYFRTSVRLCSNCVARLVKWSDE